jgi:diguanylate cyclase (GGDEF)-like protein
VVMLFDLDNFKDVNDTLGHDSGDKLLQELASRLSFFRKTAETLYRLGGDEFALISCDLSEEMALERAMVIREKIIQPYQIYDSMINIDACIGIVLSDRETRTDYLYKCADLALYEAKKRAQVPSRSSVPACCNVCRRINRLRMTCCRRSVMVNSGFITNR